MKTHQEESKSANDIDRQNPNIIMEEVNELTTSFEENEEQPDCPELRSLILN